MNIPKEALGKVTAGAKEQINAISRAYDRVSANLDEIRENQNQQMRALATIYELLVELYKGQYPGIDLPKPHIDMKIEEE